MTKMSSNPNKIYESISLSAIQRNWFDLTHVKSFTCKPGELVPCLVMPVVPGDNVKIGNVMLNRFPALIAPAFVSAKAYVHYFYVSNRIVWESFDEFFQDMAGDAGYTVPTFNIEQTMTATQQRFMDFFGIPRIADSTNKEDIDICAYAFAAFQKIYNDYYRPRPFQDPVTYLLPAAGGDIGTVTRNLLLTGRLRSWEHDYHSSMLPEPLATPDVSFGVNIALKDDWETFGSPFWNAAGSAGVAIHDGHVLQSAFVNKVDTAGVPPVDIAAWNPDNTLEGSTTYNQYREARARALYLEKMGRAGGEYYEIIQALYAERISDARLQRSEYITGSQCQISINPILATADSGAASPVGQQSGHAVGAAEGGGKTFHVNEHGFIIGIYSLIPKPVYSQGIPRHFRAFTREDYIIPDMANIGEQEVLSFEINAYEEAQDSLSTIGYLPNYTHFKQMQSTIAGEFRDDLNHYVVVKEYSGVPTLDTAFVQVPTNCMDHIFVADADISDPIWVNMLHKIDKETCLPVYSDPM